MLDILIIFIARLIVNTFSLNSKIFLSSLFGHFVLYFHSCFFHIYTHQLFSSKFACNSQHFSVYVFYHIKVIFAYFCCISNSFSIEYIVSAKNIFTDHKYRSVYE